MNAARLCILLGSLFFAGVLSSCSTTSSTTASTGTSSQRVNPNNYLYQQRNAMIAKEPKGDYYVGRRYWIEGTRFWGFVRRPGEPWHKAKLVMMNEDQKHTPDRISSGSAGPRHGYDHNYEYKIMGRYSGGRIYDPNSNQILPEFILTDYELLSRNPGFLFHPDEKFEAKRVPKPPQGL